MLHSYFGNKPELLFMIVKLLGTTGVVKVRFNAAENTLTITLANTTEFTANSKIKLQKFCGRNNWKAI